jgi:excisionase family DNA binding protein
MPTDAQTSQRLLTVQEVAQRLRLSRGTIYKHVRTGVIPAVRLGDAGASLRIPEDELEQALTVTGKDKSMTRDERTN